MISPTPCVDDEDGAGAAPGLTEAGCLDVVNRSCGDGCSMSSGVGDGSGAPGSAEVGAAIGCSTINERIEEKAMTGASAGSIGSIRVVVVGEGGLGVGAGEGFVVGGGAGGSALVGCGSGEGSGVGTCKGLPAVVRTIGGS